VVRAGVSAGIETVTVVTGHRAERLRAGAFSESPCCEVRWVHNPRFDEPNGLSLLAAEGVVSGPFLLLMADHLFERSTLDTLLRASEKTDAAVVMAVDFKVDTIRDLEDATKVMTVDSRLRAVGKSVQPFNAIDTGMFVCRAGVFPGIRAAAESGDASLSAGIATLAAGGRVETVDIGGGRWIDVDTPEARILAERMVAAGELS
jgi:choline kinase